jgi:hypothetical protein
MFKFIDKAATAFTDRLTYSVENMSMPQWGILTVLALLVGFVMLKSRR